MKRFNVMKFYKWMLPAILLVGALITYMYGVYGARYYLVEDLNFFEWLVERDWEYQMDNYLIPISKPFMVYYLIIGVPVVIRGIVNKIKQFIRKVVSE